MKRVFSAIFKAIASLSLFALFQASLEAAGQLTANGAEELSGVPEYGFQLTLSVTTNIFQLNKPMMLRISLQNVSTNDLSVDVDDDLFDYTFTITGHEEKDVLVTEMGEKWLHPAVFYNRSFDILPPGQKLTDTIPLNLLFSMTNAGEYTINVTRRIHGKKEVSANGLKLRAISLPSL